MHADATALAPTSRHSAATEAASRRDRRHRRIRKVISYLLLSVGAVVILFPIYIAIVNSLLAPSQIAHQPPPFFPTHPMWSTYPTAWNEGHLGLYLRNSAIMTAIIVVGQVVTAILAAYAFAFLSFPFRKTLFIVFLSTLMIPFEVTLITNLDTVTRLGWYNTFQGLTVPFLGEAATLDGYGHWRFMTRVAVPLARPAVAAVAVFSFLASWNNYLWPLVVTGDNNNVRTVQIGLKLLANTEVQNINVTLAGTIIAIVPLVILLLVFQKQLVRGLTAGAVK
jgi:sn-glycerol 3-phosphate transport system permease protein